MAKSKSDEKKKKVKASQLVVRVEKADRNEFVKLCKEQCSTAGKEIRGFMRDRLDGRRAEKPVESSDGSEAASDASARTEPEVGTQERARKKASVRT
jgi:hypothetical protein